MTRPLSIATLSHSRLMLGTVQFGMPYGVSNRTGQPSYETVRAILSVALEGGVDGFDTAAAYGSSEAVLGRALEELKVNDRVIVVTKVKPLTSTEWADPGLAKRAIEASVEASRQRLRLDCLPIVLFHREADARYLDVLETLKSRGWLHATGVSCDHRPGPAIDFVRSGHVAALQLPANLLDRRHQHSGVFRAAAAADVAVFVRSVFLQGLLATGTANFPPALRALAPVCERLAKLADRGGITTAELAVRYMLSQPGVSRVLAGVETVRQIRDNLEYFNRGALDADLVQAVDRAVPDLPDAFVTPSLWPTLSETAR